MVIFRMYFDLQHKIVTKVQKNAVLCETAVKTDDKAGQKVYTAVIIRLAIPRRI